MAASTSTSSYIVPTDVAHEFPYPYPYPSHVFVPSFVTVKLSGKDMYDLWKTQMLCLLESHDMLCYIYVSHDHRGKEKVSDYKLWKRSDALVKGWILGSLSEQPLRSIVNHLHTSTADFTAKDVWDELETICGPAARQQAVADYEEERTTEVEEMMQRNSVSDETKEEEISEEKIQRAEERAYLEQKLYVATLTGGWESVARILRNGQIKVTDKIAINGNTALHVAVGTTKNKEFLEKMLEMAPDSTLSLKNVEGSTLLHVAAIVGNTDAAKMLVDRNRYLLSAEDHEGQTPLARALSNMHTDTYLYLLDVTCSDVELGAQFVGRRGDELLVNAISSKDFKSARALERHYHTMHNDIVLTAIAQNFPSELNFWERTASTEISRLRGDSPFSILLATMTVKGLRLTTFGFEVITLLSLAVLGLFPGLLEAMMRILVRPFVKKKAQVYDDATCLLRSVCNLIKHSNHSSARHHFYTNPLFEATKQNAYKVVERIVYTFPNAIWSVNEDGHNIIQYAVINRSDEIYNLLYQMSEHKNIYRTIKDPFGNNLLHLAARLTPTNKLNLISGAALQIQRELQWFREVKRFVSPLNIIQKNSFGETPEMVFTREHKELVVEGEKWMKATAESYTITAALITTIVFAAAITVPGGNNEDGLPVFTNKSAFIIFAVSDAISLFTSVTSLLMFLSILTARFAEQDFLFKLPTKLIIGLATLFISTTAMIVAFGASLFLVFGRENSWILYPIAALTCLPITSFVTLQFPLIADLISATYGCSIFGKKRNRPFY